ncbi:hypothetical protein OIV83_003267 [Microbotryomycetes sp. JL201]|nr:hypothetical protein OIV83_003267 [Microbotryomycetes sp. JL201]
MSASEPNPLDTLTGIPVADQAYATGILGPGFVGWGVQLLFYGVAANMFLNYVRSSLFARDRPVTKAVLMVTMLAATAQTGLTFNSLFHYGTSQRRDAVTLYAQTYPDCFITLPSAISGSCVQTFFVWRAGLLIHRKSLKIAFLTFSALLIVASLLGGCAFVVISFMDKNGLAIPEAFDFNVTTGLWLVGGASADIVVTLCLVYILRSHMHGFNRTTDSIMRQLIKLAIETASYTTIFAICAAVLSFAFTDGSTLSNSALAFYLPLSAFYVISLLVNLSARERIQATSQEPYTLPTIVTTDFTTDSGGPDGYLGPAVHQTGTKQSASTARRAKMGRLFAFQSPDTSSRGAARSHGRSSNSGGAASAIQVDEAIEIVTESASDDGDEEKRLGQ